MIEYRPRPAVVLRTAGFALVLLALVVACCLVVASVLATGFGWVVLVAAIGVALVALAAALSSRRAIVRLSEDGFRVSGVRGSAVSAAAWTEVDHVATSYDGGLPVLHLDLRDGRRATIPVGALSVDKDEFVRAVRAHLVRR